MKILLSLVLLVRLAAAQTATQVVIPTYAGTADYSVSSPANQLRCVVFNMPFSITNATKLIFGVVVADGTCSMGLYPDSDTGSILLSCNGISCATPGAKVGTSSAVTLTVGTPYRLCMCSSSISTTVTAIEDITGMRVGDALNIKSVRMGTGTPCTAGTLGPTTGPLRPFVFRAPVAVIE